MASNFQKDERRDERFERHKREEQEAQEKSASWQPDATESGTRTDSEDADTERLKRIKEGTRRTEGEV